MPDLLERNPRPLPTPVVRGKMIDLPGRSTMQSVLFLMIVPQPWRAAAFAKKRMAASISACGGSVVSHVASLSSGQFSNAEYPLRSGLWHPLNVPLPRAPSKRGLQHGRRPVRCAALFNTSAFPFASSRRLARCFANDRRRQVPGVALKQVRHGRGC